MEKYLSTCKAEVRPRRNCPEFRRIRPRRISWSENVYNEAKKVYITILSMESSSAHDIQVTPRVHNFHSAVLFEVEQVAVAGDDVIGSGGEGAFEVHIVFGVSADAFYAVLGGDGDFLPDMFYTHNYPFNIVFA